MRLVSFSTGLCLLITACSSSPGMPEASSARPAAAERVAAEAEEVKTVPEPPIATPKPHRLELHGETRVDPYYWLKERENPQVIEYLEKENAYTRAMLSHTKALQKELFEEITGRIKKDDATVPYRLEDYDYHQRYEEDREYPIYRRRSLAGDEEIMLDVNELAVGHQYLRVRGVVVSGGQRILAYATDTVGRRLYTLRFRDLATGEDLPDEIPDVTGNHVWANDDRTIFYTKQHPETLRWYRIYRHVLGTDPQEDELVFEETDEEFGISLEKSKSRRFIFLFSEQTLATEYRYLDADDPLGTFEVFLPRQEGHEYSIEHRGDEFYVRTNWKAQNFRLMAAPISATGRESWREVLGHRSDVYLAGFELFDDFLVVAERHKGLIEMRVIPADGSAEHSLDFGEPVYDVAFGDNYQLDSSVCGSTR